MGGLFMLNPASRESQAKTVRSQEMLAGRTKRRSAALYETLVVESGCGRRRQAPWAGIAVQGLSEGTDRRAEDRRREDRGGAPEAQTAKETRRIDGRQPSRAAFMFGIVM